MKLKRNILLVTVLCAVAMLLCAPVSALSAQHAAVMDAQTGMLLFERDADSRCLIASTTKIMTGLLVCEDCDLTRCVSVSPEAVGIEGSSLYLKAGEKLTIEELLYGLMLQSGNDAAVALAMVHSGSVEAFVERMNARARELGLQNTHFANPNGLDDEENYSTSADLARLACAAMDNPSFARVAATKYYRFGEHALTNHNKLLWRFDGADGVKTGFTKAAGRILVSSAVRGGRRLICVTINAPDDWNDHTQLLEEGFSRFELRTLCRKGQIFGGTAPDGCVHAVYVAAEDVEANMLPEESVEEIRINIDRQQTGCAEFFSHGRRIAVCPLETIGATNGGTNPENHSITGDHIPPGSGGDDPCRSCASEWQHGSSGGLCGSRRGCH